MNELLLFRTYPDPASAEQVALLLKDNGIGAEVSKEARVLDSNYIGQQFSDPYLLYLQGADFERATLILEDQVVIRPEEVDPGYMLLSFSDEELIDVMKKKDEWGIYNYKLAEALLKKKNVPIPEIQIVLEQTERLKEKEKAVSSGLLFLLLGYASIISGAIMSLRYNIAFIFLPGLLGLLIGWNLSHFKRTLSNGQRTFYYNSTTRFHGSIMFWTGLAIAAMRFIFQLITLMTI